MSRHPRKIGARSIEAARGTCAWVRLFWCFGLVLLTSSAAAEKPKPKLVDKVMSIERTGDSLSLTFDATEFGSAEVARKLNSGLPQTFVVEAYAYRERDGELLAGAAQTCRVVYDLWEGTYRVRLQRVGKRKSLELRTPEEVLRTCLRINRLPFERAALAEARGTRVYCAVLVEFNPISQATLERIRRWLSRPSSAGAMRGDAFFGSFVSIFVGRDIGRAERSAAYRSQPWTVP